MDLSLFPATIDEAIAELQAQWDHLVTDEPDIERADIKASLLNSTINNLSLHRDANKSFARTNWFSQWSTHPGAAAEVARAVEHATAGLRGANAIGGAA